MIKYPVLSHFYAHWLIYQTPSEGSMYVILLTFHILERFNVSTPPKNSVKILQFNLEKRGSMIKCAALFHFYAHCLIYQTLIEGMMYVILLTAHFFEGLMFLHPEK